MGLYLCVFESDEADDDLGGVEMGGYDDFHAFRQTICDQLEGGTWGSRFPTLMGHADSSGAWSAQECRAVIDELRQIQAGLSGHPPLAYDGWQAEAARLAGHNPQSLADFFIDVDGEPLIERLIDLANLAASTKRSITFM